MASNLYINPAAQVHAEIRDVRGRVLSSNSFAPVVGPPVIDLLGSDLTSASPWTLILLCDYGVEVTINNPRLWCQVEGKYIILNTAPAVDERIVIKDGTVDTQREAIIGTAADDVYEIQTPWPAEEVRDLHYVQANDLMYLVHERHHPRVLKRYAVYDWRIEQPDFTNGGSPAGTDPAWAESVYDPALGYPRTVQFFQQRLIFGGSISEPQTIWGSRVADFENFTIPDTNPAPDDAVTLVIAAQTQEAIQWLGSSRALFIGTSGNEHRVTVNSFLAIDNLPDVTRQSQYGSRHIQPEFIGTAVMFVQSSGREIRTYDLDRNANVEFYDSLNVAWLSEHITEGGVIALSYWRDSLLCSLVPACGWCSLVHDL